MRVDSAIYSGYRVPPYYDSLIGKLIVRHNSRELALLRLGRSLDEYVVDGVKTTIPLFQELLQQPDVQTGNYDIRWLETLLAKTE